MPETRCGTFPEQNCQLGSTAAEAPENKSNAQLSSVRHINSLMPLPAGLITRQCKSFVTRCLGLFLLFIGMKRLLCPVCKGGPSITRKLKVEDHAGRNAQILLRLRVSASCSEARQEVIHLDRTNGEMFCQFDVKPATYRHGKAIVRSVCRGGTCAHAFCAEEHLAEGRDAVPVAVRNPRTKKIGGQGEVQASVQNVAVMISAEIGDAAQPVIHIVSKGRATAVEIEVLCPIPPIIGIPGKDIHFGMILAPGHSGQEREKRKQRHHEPTLH